MLSPAQVFLVQLFRFFVILTIHRDKTLLDAQKIGAQFCNVLFRSKDEASMAPADLTRSNRLAQVCALAPALLARCYQ